MLRTTFEWLLRAATVLVGVGLYEFETSMSLLVIPGLPLVLTSTTQMILVLRQLSHGFGRLEIYKGGKLYMVHWTFAY
jgi:hypothetical protein